MSLAHMQAVLSSNHTKSSTRFAHVLLAFHACERCGRVYCSVNRLAREMNIDPRNAKMLLKKLRDEKYLEPTGETTSEGVVVYQLRGVMKACRFCRQGVMNSSPNKQSFDRQENDRRARDADDHRSPARCVGKPGKREGKRYCPYHQFTHFAEKE